MRADLLDVATLSRAAPRTSFVDRSSSVSAANVTPSRVPALDDGYRGDPQPKLNVATQNTIPTNLTPRVSVEVAQQTAFDLIVSTLGPPTTQSEQQGFLQLHAQYSSLIQQGKLAVAINDAVTHPRFRERAGILGAVGLATEVRSTLLGSTGGVRNDLQTQTAIQRGGLAQHLWDSFRSQSYADRLVKVLGGINSTGTGVTSGPSGGAGGGYPSFTKGNLREAAVQAATWVQTVLPKSYFPIERDGEDVMRLVVNSLKANGYNVGRNVIDGRENLAADDKYRYGSDTIIDGNTGEVYDLFGSGKTPQMLSVGISRNGILA